MKKFIFNKQTTMASEEDRVDELNQEEEEIEDLVLSGAQELEIGDEEEMMNRVLQQMQNADEEGGIGDMAFEQILSSMLGGLRLNEELTTMMGGELPKRRRRKKRQQIEDLDNPNEEEQDDEEDDEDEEYDDDEYDDEEDDGDNPFFNAMGGGNMSELDFEKMMLAPAFAPENMLPSITELKDLLVEWLSKDENKEDEKEFERVTQIAKKAQDIVNLYETREYPESLDDIMEAYRGMQALGSLPEEVAKIFGEEEEEEEQVIDQAPSCQTQ